MMKINGQEYGVSVIKIYMDDRLVKMLEELTERYRMPDNKHMIGLLIESAHKQLSMTLDKNNSKDDKGETK